MKYILITGGIISGVGKGIIASSTGLYLRSKGHNVTAIKIDPYLNIDSGTIQPMEHGEVFVLDDGSEVDLDLGNYERFIDLNLTKLNSITTGKVYRNVLEKERRGDYLGQTIQVIPHLTNEILDMIDEASQNNVCYDSNSKVEVCIIELGGVINDIESSHFIEALRQLLFKVGKENFITVHVGLIPFHNEYKTKPMQASVRTLRSLGITPDIIVCRSETPISQSHIDKVSLFTGVKNVINVHNVSNLYCVPEVLEEKLYFEYISQHFGNFQPSLINHQYDPKLFETCQNISKTIKDIDSNSKSYVVGIVGKYMNSPDTYLSISNSINHAKYFLKMKLEIIWIDSCSENLEEKLKLCDGILVPGGFGKKGIEGMITASNYARVNNIPFLGICLGFQIALIEFARNVLNIQQANTEEIDLEGKSNIIIRMDDLDKANLGGTMRLGKKEVLFNQTSFVKKFYEDSNLLYDNSVFERFRHRYEFNTKYKSEFESKGIKFVATDSLKDRMSIFELDNHVHFLGVQFHPEFKSRFYRPSPPFLSFLDAIRNVI